MIIGFFRFHYGDPYGGAIQTAEEDFGPVNGWEWHAAVDPGTGSAILWSNDSALSTSNANDDLLITFPSGPPGTKLPPSTRSPAASPSSMPPSTTTAEPSSCAPRR